MDNVIYTATTWVIPLLLCVILHEVAHGWMAMKLGDYTAKVTGRLTLNPKEHIDPIGSLLVPGVLLLVQAPFLFGWAKPVPVDYRNLHHPKRDMGLVAAAGPAANILLAVLFVLSAHVFKFLPDGQMKLWVFQNLGNGIGLSLILAIFNLIPILPLDGGRILSSLLPLKLSIEYQKTEAYGFYVLLGLLIIGPIIKLDIVGWFINVLYPLFAGILQLFM
ncbi:MAG: site-2 protease family protein [Alphaproteobacteria bacterium]